MRRADQGFTLIEMMVVLAIMGVLIGIAVSRGPVRSQGLQTRAAAGALAQALRTARAQAIARSQTVTVVIDPVRRLFTADGAPPQALAAGLGLEARPPALPGPNGTKLIQFGPDGSATGGEVLLGSGRRRVAVEVEWLTGRVQVTNAP